MRAPALTQEWFDETKLRGLTPIKTIGKLNSKNCRKDFTQTIPKPLREEGWNAYLVMKNHRERFKYIGFNVENIAGRLKIITNPEFIWAGYVFHANTWYAVSSNDLISGTIKASCKVIIPEIEYDSSDD